MAPRVKICGLTRPEDAETAFSLGADYLGLVFAKSPRNVDLGGALRIVEAVPTFQNMVGVFQNERQEAVEQIASELGLGYLQFHGDETPAYCDYFTRAGFKIIKVIPVERAVSLDAFNRFNVFAFMFDTKKGNRFGGTGTPFDWSLLPPSLWETHRCFLSGGLSPENVSRALSMCAPFAVDVSSGVESAPGQKDIQRMSAFITHVKRDMS